MLISYAGLVGSPTGVAKQFVYSRAALQYSDLSLTAIVAISEIATRGEHRLPTSLDAIRAAASVSGRYYVQRDALPDDRYIIIREDTEILVGYYNTSRL